MSVSSHCDDNEPHGTHSGSTVTSRSYDPASHLVHRRASRRRLLGMMIRETASYPFAGGVPYFPAASITSVTSACMALGATRQRQQGNSWVEDHQRMIRALRAAANEASRDITTG
jgi:hypothetical protein